MKKHLFFLLGVLLTLSPLRAQYTSQYSSPYSSPYATRSAAQYSSPYADRMSSGSPYVSAPYAVGAASPEPMYRPATPPSYAPSRPRRETGSGAPGDDEDEKEYENYDPDNPELNPPLTDGTWCLLLLLALYAAATGWRRYKRKQNLQNV